MTLNPHLLKSTVVAALGGLLFGFDTAVIAGTTRSLASEYHLSPGALGFTVASALWGTVLGSMLASIPSDRYGRRGSLQGLAVLYLVSAVGCACAWSWHSFTSFRLIGGLAIGGSSVIAPMYIAEISPASRRGRLVALFQFNVVLGILVAYLSNYLIGLIGLGNLEWRWKLGICSLPAAFFFLALFTISESPRWLVQKGRVVEAREVLERMGEQHPDEEVQDIVNSIRSEGNQTRERLFSRKYRLPIYLAISIAMFNQLAGINAILYYLNEIFERAGFSKVSSDLQAVAIGFTNLVFTMAAISVIDKVGRRQLLLIGAVGTALCLSGVAAVFATGKGQHLLLWLLVAYIAFFAFSQGAVIWVYISEVFPNLVRAKGQSLGSLTHWFMNALISGLFPLIAASSRALPFVFFALMMVLQFFVVLFTFPETKGVSLEEMQWKLGIR